MEARYNGGVDVPDELVRLLPAKVALFTSVQFLGSIKSAAKKIEGQGKKVILIRTEHTKHAGQLLGCNIKEFKEDFDAFLYIGDGLFHPKALMLKNNKPVFVLNPFSKKYFKLEEKDVKDVKKKQRGALLGFMSSKEVGVLISTKPGQYNIRKAYELEERFPEKNFYYLVFNTLNYSELENFPFIECFVNTACPRISYDEAYKFRKPVINVDDILRT